MNEWTRRVRAAFPALERRAGGEPIAFLDGPAGTQVPRPVLDAITGYLTGRNANTEGAFATSRESDALIRRARETAAAFLGSSTPESIVFGANMTTLTFHLSRGLAAGWQAGDELIVTDLDHQANVAPWHRIAREHQLVVRTVPFHPATCTLDYNAMSRLAGERTRLIAVGHASNAVGTVNDIGRVAEIAQRNGSLLFVDAVHSAPHLSLDVEELGCDFLACSAYKFFGPHVGVLWGRPELLAAIDPPKLPPAPDQAPGRWETGTLNHEGIAGTAAAIEWIAGLAPPARVGAPLRERIGAGIAGIRAHEQPLVRDLIRELASMDGIRIYGPPEGAPRTPTVAITLAQHTATQVAEALGRRGIQVWDGDFYATTVIDRLDLREQGGVVRIGVAPYTSDRDIERLLGALHDLTRE
jgi:cysteine desulfurase family protein (TIGR01976 family)